MEVFNLVNFRNNYSVVVDTDIQLIVKNLKNGEMLRFNREPLNIKLALEKYPNLPILVNDIGVFILKIEIKPSEIMIEVNKTEKEGVFKIEAKHKLVSTLFFEKEIKAKNILEALDKARSQRDKIKGPIFADNYGRSTNNNETQKGRSMLTKKWAK